MDNKYMGAEAVSALKKKVPVVVQSTGVSTTEVMSQKAVTDIVGDIDSLLTQLDTGTGV